MIRKVVCVILALMVGEAGSAFAGPSTDSAETSRAHWQALLEGDLEFWAQTLREKYIYAVYPHGEAWAGQLESALTQARNEAVHVADFPGYRAVAQHFAAQLEDAHARIHFDVNPTTVRWPGFLVRYRASRYVVVESRTDQIPAGTAIDACDDRPLDEWVDEVAGFEGGPKGLETTRVSIGSLLFVDRGGPLYRIPQRCLIGDREIELQWSDISLEPSNEYGATPALEPLNRVHAAFRDTSASIAEFGEHGAWVRPRGETTPAFPPNKRLSRYLPIHPWRCFSRSSRKSASCPIALQNC